MITYHPKTFENPIIVDIKSATKEYPKISHKLSKTITIRQTKKVVSNSPLYRETKYVNIFKTKKCKNKQESGFKHSYNVKTLNSFNP